MKAYKFVEDQGLAAAKEHLLTLAHIEELEKVEILTKAIADFELVGIAVNELKKRMFSSNMIDQSVKNWLLKNSNLLTGKGLRVKQAIQRIETALNEEKS